MGITISQTTPPLSKKPGISSSHSPDRTLTVSSVSGTFSQSGLDKGNRRPSRPRAAPTRGDVGGCGVWLGTAGAHPGPSPTNGHRLCRRRQPPCTDKRRQTTRPRAGFTGIHAITPDHFPERTTIDCLWSNPPIRIGKTALHDLLTTWLNRLSTEGSAWLVVSKNLGADSLRAWLNTGGAGAFQCERVAGKKSFRILRVTRAPKR